MILNETVFSKNCYWYIYIMINLEWLRTFRTVYKTKSLSKASELLMISQPTVSQHISALETHIGQKLFVRKSKGVLETEEGKILNTLVSGTIENLERVEQQLLQKDSDIKNILKIGVSEHLYKSIFCKHVPQLGKHVHVTFGNKQELKSQVENGKLYCAVVPEKLETFDLICDRLYSQKLVLASSLDIDLDQYEEEFKKGVSHAEQWLEKQTWYAHNSMSSLIKLYWLHTFNKKRPSVIPNYIIPNEHEVLYQLAQNSGVCITTQSTLYPFTHSGTLKSSDIADLHWRDLYLISNKKNYSKELTQKVINTIRRDVTCVKDH